MSALHRGVDICPHADVPSPRTTRRNADVHRSYTRIFTAIQTDFAAVVEALAVGSDVTAASCGIYRLSTPARKSVFQQAERVAYVRTY